MDASDSISFRVEDVGMDGLGTGDEIQLDFEADRLNFHGTLGSINDSPGRGDGLAGRLSGMGDVAERPGLPSLLKMAKNNSIEGFDVARHAFLKILRNYSIYVGKVLA